MLTATDWANACDEVVAELIDQAEVATPPVDSLQLGRRLNMTLAWDAAQAGRGRLLRRGDAAAILLKPDDRPERIQWAAAHEVGESVAWKVAARLGQPFDDRPPSDREDLANEIARRLLLPTRWFRAAVDDVSGDLVELKGRFTSASHELIAWRLLDLPAARVVTVWDHGKLTRRRANFRPPPLMPLERRTWQRAHDDGSPQTDLGPFGRIRVWPIHEVNWKREIACWEFPSDGDFDASELD